MAKAATEGEIVRRRRSVSVKHLKWKKEQGALHGKERALIRMGKAATDVMIGSDDLSDWSDEELKRGRRAGKGGIFRGPDPVAVPRQCMTELARRIMEQAQDVLRTSLVEAVTALTEIATNGDYEAKDRVRAIGMVMDRVMGKDAQKVQLDVEVPWKVALRGAIVSVPVEDTEVADGE